MPYPKKKHAHLKQLAQSKKSKALTIVSTRDENLSKSECATAKLLYSQVLVEKPAKPLPSNSIAPLQSLIAEIRMSPHMIVYCSLHQLVINHAFQ